MGIATKAMWSQHPADRVIIFVHGFGGDPDTTWPDFPSLLRRAPEVAGNDILFYGYDGFTTQATNSGVRLFDMLDNFLSDPATIVNQTIPSNRTRAPFRYSTVVIVAHSLGAVVTRLALLKAHRRVLGGKSHPWLKTVRLVLLAPAHSGAYAADVATKFLEGLDWWVAKVAAALTQLYIPLLTDLRQDSPLIASLASDTAAALAGLPAGTPTGYLQAESVVWADPDKVVWNNVFCKDADENLAYGLDHFSVSKPRLPNHPAFAALMAVLRGPHE